MNDDSHFLRSLSCTHDGYYAKRLVEIADEIERLRAENERLREWIHETINSLVDPQDACDHGGSDKAALLATINEAIGKLRAAIKLVEGK